MSLSKLLLGTTLVSTTANKAPVTFQLSSFLKDLPIDHTNDNIVDISLKLITSIIDKSNNYVKEQGAVASDNPFFNILPMWRASLVPDATVKVSNMMNLVSHC